MSTPPADDARKPLTVEPEPAVDWHGMIGRHPKMLAVYKLAEIVAGRDCNIVILGETGTGKNILARAIHSISPRKDKPFKTIHCSAIPHDLLESELFGHRKGSFTTAIQDRLGMIEAADGGTLFLDEIGDMPLETQTKLLKFVEDRTVQRVGENLERKLDVRLICATHRDLSKLVEAGRFRADLMYRVSVVELHLPPLRERQSDIDLLADGCLGAICSQSLVSYALPYEVRQLLTAHDWPGNVRELQNAIERATVLCDGNVLLPEHFCLPQKPEKAKRPSHTKKN